MNIQFHKLYVAMLKHEGTITRCEEVVEGLFAIEYKYLHPYRDAEHFNEMRAPDTLSSHMWIGDLSKLSEYLGDLHWNDHESFKWEDDDTLYHSLLNIVVREDLNAARTNRDISTDSGEGIQTRVKRTSDRRIHPQVISPER